MASESQSSRSLVPCKRRIQHSGRAKKPKNRPEPSTIGFAALKSRDFDITAITLSCALPREHRATIPLPRNSHFALALVVMPLLLVVVIVLLNGRSLNLQDPQFRLVGAGLVLNVPQVWSASLVYGSKPPVALVAKPGIPHIHTP